MFLCTVIRYTNTFFALWYHPLSVFSLTSACTTFLNSVSIFPKSTSSVYSCIFVDLRKRDDITLGVIKVNRSFIFVVISDDDSELFCVCCVN